MWPQIFSITQEKNNRIRVEGARAVVQMIRLEFCSGHMTSWNSKCSASTLPSSRQHNSCRNCYSLTPPPPSPAPFFYLSFHNLFFVLDGVGSLSPATRVAVLSSDNKILSWFSVNFDFSSEKPKTLPMNFQLTFSLI